MRLSTSQHLAAALITLAGTLSPALAQDARPGSLDPRSVGADPKEGRPAVEALMAKVKAALADVNAISYRAYSNAYPKIAGKSGPGPEGRLIRKHVFDVQLAKADTGAWKFAITLADDAVEGDTKPDADEPVHAPRVAFDTLTLRVLRDDQKAVFERTASSKDLANAADFEGFLDQHGASMTVIWDFLEQDNPLGNAGRAAGAYVERDDTVDGEPCAVLRVMDMPGVYVPEAFKDEVGTRYKISRKTSLPLMVERIRPGGAPNTYVLSRSIVVTDWKTNADAVPGDYSVAVPDGYRVRAAQKATVASKPEAPAKPGAGEPKQARKTGMQNADARAASFGLATGAAAPDFSLKTPGGQTRTLADYKGKLVLLDFWGSWCPPCRAAMPSMQNLHARYKDQGLAVVGMNYERAKTADPAKYMKDHGLDYELLLNAEKVTDAYKIRGFPTFYLLDREGKVLWSAVGHDPSHEQELDKLIKAQLKSK